jgi:hypothetical protein
VNATTTATALVVKNFDRVALVLDNRGPATVYLGDAATVTAATGIALLPFAQWIDSASTSQGAFNYKGPYYGIVAAGSANVRVLELETTR